MAMRIPGILLLLLQSTLLLFQMRKRLHMIEEVFDVTSNGNGEASETGVLI